MYAKIVSNVVEAFPYTFSQLRADYPNVSFPANIDLAPESARNQFNVFTVTQKPDPAFNPATQYLVQGTPVLENGAWVVTRVVTAKTAEQIAQELKAAQQAEDAEAVKVDTQVKNLLTARPAQINAYIETNVTNLAQAKEVLKILARALAVVAQKTFD